MIENRLVSTGSNKEILPNLISEYRKYSSLVKEFKNKITLNSSNYSLYDYTLFGLGASIARLCQYGLFEDSVRDLKFDIQSTLGIVSQWFNNLDGLSQKWIKQSVEYNLAMTTAYVEIVKQPKAIEETTVNLSLSIPSSEQISQSLAEMQETTPLADTGIASSTPQIVLLPDYHQLIREPKERTDPHRTHPMFGKYEHLHPLDLALLNVLKSKGYDTQNLSQEDLNQLLGRGMGFHLNNDEEIIRVVPEIEAARILKQIYEKNTKKQELNTTEKSKGVEALEFAAQCLIKQTQDKLKK